MRIGPVYSGLVSMYLPSAALLATSAELLALPLQEQTLIITESERYSLASPRRRPVRRQATWHGQLIPMRSLGPLLLQGSIRPLHSIMVRPLLETSRRPVV